MCGITVSVHLLVANIELYLGLPQHRQDNNHKYKDLRRLAAASAATPSPAKRHSPFAYKLLDVEKCQAKKSPIPQSRGKRLSASKKQASKLRADENLRNEVGMDVYLRMDNQLRAYVFVVHVMAATSS